MDMGNIWTRIGLWICLAVWLLPLPALRAQEITIRQREDTGFRLANLTVGPCRQGVVRLTAVIRNGTDRRVSNLLVLFTLRDRSGKEIHHFYSIIDPPLPLDPGATGTVIIPVLTHCTAFSVAEYKIVGLL